MNDTVIIFSAYFFYTQGWAMSRQSLCFLLWIQVCCMWLLQCTVEICGCQWHVFASVQWLNCLWS